MEDKNKEIKKKTVKDENQKEVNICKELLSLIIYIGIVILVCFVIIKFVGCRSRVDGSSMNPTLDDGDSLWVSKIAYTIGKPKRFDVVIFNYDENTTYVKRIIGLPGENVYIDKEGSIYIDGAKLEENYGKERMNDPGRAGVVGGIDLGEDEYFVLGDNRNNSSDSRRADVGNINRADIVGKAAFRIYPFSSFGIVK